MLFALMLIVVMSLLAWAFLNNSESAMFSSYRVAARTRSIHLAEGGLRYFLTLREGWNATRDERFEVGQGEIHLQVIPVEQSVLVRSTGTVHGVRRTVVMVYDLNGSPMSRHEE